MIVVRKAVSIQMFQPLVSFAAVVKSTDMHSALVSPAVGKFHCRDM